MPPGFEPQPQEWYGQTWVHANATDTRPWHWIVAEVNSCPALLFDEPPKPKRSDFWRAILKIPRDRDLWRPEVAKAAPKPVKRRWFAQMGKDRRLTRSASL